MKVMIGEEIRLEDGKLGVVIGVDAQFLHIMCRNKTVWIGIKNLESRSCRKTGRYYPQIEQVLDSMEEKISRKLSPYESDINKDLGILGN